MYICVYEGDYTVVSNTVNLGMTMSSVLYWDVISQVGLSLVLPLGIMVNIRKIMFIKNMPIRV